MVRSESLRVVSGDRTHRIFRPSDLIHGEVLGKGFFGQAVKVLHLHFHFRNHFISFIVVANFVVSSIIFYQHCD